MPFNNGLIKIDPSRPENNIFHLSNFIFIKKKMDKNIIIFNPSSERGGVTKILINLLKSKNSKGFNFHIISSDHPLKKKLNRFFIEINTRRYFNYLKKFF